ncbi:hypothetical protein ABH935_009538 [Catenulispora sp. GAS73]|uniref:hypothetical protein n=1 Tax=Catenulispora sp. GAS73 TaxID=3156269 RepID=UPI003516F5AB
MRLVLARGDGIQDGKAAGRVAGTGSGGRDPECGGEGEAGALLADDPRWRFVVPDGGLSLWLQLTARRAGDLVASAEAAGLRFSPGSRFAVDATLARFLRVPFTPPVGVLDRVAATLRGLV